MNDQSVAVGQLRAFVERVERVEEEIKTFNDDKSEIYKEIRGFGFDVKAVRKVVAKRKLDPSVRDEQDAMFDLYWDALTGSVHVHTPAREIIEEFDAETGEITTVSLNEEGREAQSSDVKADAANVGGGHVASSVLRASSDVKVVATNSPETASEVPAQDSGGTATGESLSDKSNAARPASVDAQLNAGGQAGQACDSDVTAGETATDFTPPTFLREHINLRPNCLHPNACAGYGSKTCHSCTKAAVEVAA